MISTPLFILLKSIKKEKWNIKENEQIGREIYQGFLQVLRKLLCCLECCVNTLPGIKK